MSRFRRLVQIYLWLMSLSLAIAGPSLSFADGDGAGVIDFVEQGEKLPYTLVGFFKEPVVIIFDGMIARRDFRRNCEKIGVGLSTGRGMHGFGVFKKFECRRSLPGRGILKKVSKHSWEVRIDRARSGIDVAISYKPPKAKKFELYKSFQITNTSFPDAAREGIELASVIAAKTILHLPVQAIVAAGQKGKDFRFLASSPSFQNFQITPPENLSLYRFSRQGMLKVGEASIQNDGEQLQWVTEKPIGPVRPPFVGIALGKSRRHFDTQYSLVVSTLPGARQKFLLSNTSSSRDRSNVVLLSYQSALINDKSSPLASLQVIDFAYGHQLFLGYLRIGASINPKSEAVTPAVSATDEEASRFYQSGMYSVSYGLGGRVQLEQLVDLNLSLGPLLGAVTSSGSFDYVNPYTLEFGELSYKADNVPVGGFYMSTYFDWRFLGANVSFSFYQSLQKSEVDFSTNKFLLDLKVVSFADDSQRIGLAVGSESTTITKTSEVENENDILQRLSAKSEVEISYSSIGLSYLVSF